jgi:hypothetical protein
MYKLNLDETVIRRDLIVKIKIKRTLGLIQD